MEQITAERAWYNSEKVWLVHKDGFSLGEEEKSLLIHLVLMILQYLCFFFSKSGDEVKKQTFKYPFFVPQWVNIQCTMSLCNPHV